MTDTKVGHMSEMDTIRQLLCLETAKSVFMGELRPDWMGVAAEVVEHETVTGTIVFIPGVSLSELEGNHGCC